MRYLAKDFGSQKRLFKLSNGLEDAGPISDAAYLSHQAEHGSKPPLIITI